MKGSFFAFYIIPVLPAVVIGTGTQSTLCAILALFFMTLWVSFWDFTSELIPQNAFSANLADAISVTLAITHFAVLLSTLYTLSQNQVGLAHKIALFMAAGLYLGQVSNSNAHELIHHRKRILFQLGKWVYISLLFGHHTTAHPAVHHRFVATKDDPNSAALDEGFYSFFARAWLGSFKAGYAVEKERLSLKNKAAWHLENPYWQYVGGGMVCIILAASFGARTLLWYLGLALYAQIQLMLSDYVQHYGLLRKTMPNGKYEPVGPQHSWNAPQWYSSFLMLNAPRHSDHHAHPTRRFPELRLPPNAPTLPFSLPMMATLALIPHLWRRYMTPRVKIWAEVSNASDIPNA
jgi:alkane 1-monooxygenase